MSEEKKEVSGVLKQFGLSSLSLKNKMTVFVLTAIIAFAGIFSYISMPREAFPEVVIPQIYVGTPYPGNSSADIEKLITRPLEKEIKSISGIDKMTSTSVQGYSTIFIEFDFSVTPEEALRKVKDKVDIAKGDPDFPQDLPAEPNIFEMNMSEMMPIMNLNLSGDYSVEQLKQYAEQLEDRIEVLPEITEVDVRGVNEKEVKINVDLAKMEAMDISFNDISNAIRSENVTISGGDILNDDMRRTVRVIGEFQNIEEVEDVTIKQEKFDIVYLRDIASVVFEEAEKTSYAREYEQPVVMVDVKKRAGENLINASEQINEILADMQATVIPEDITITITNDQSDQTRTMVSELENSIIFGMLLVVLVLLFFLGIRNALFVGVAIPLSMFMAFFILGAMGVTLNMMVLFSLILALGMLVDNGIVVVENIYRLMDEGMSAKDAAKYGVGEVALPIIASTATTLAAFIPLAIWPGLMGEFMKYLPITLMIVLGSSLFVALVINPVLTSVLMKVEETPANPKNIWIVAGIMMVTGMIMRVAPEAASLMGVLVLIAGIIMAIVRRNSNWGQMLGISIAGLLLIIFTGWSNLIWGSIAVFGGLIGLVNYYILSPATKFFQTRILPYLERKYNSFIHMALSGSKPVVFFLGTIGTLIFSLVLFGLFPPKVLFFPVNEPQYLNIFIEAPIGTDIEETDRITKQLETRIMDYITKFEESVQTEDGEERKNYLVKSVIAQVGEGTSDPTQGPSMANTPHKARISVSFVEYMYRRGINTSDVLEEVRDVMKGVPGIQITVDKNENGPPVGKPINIEITGDDYDQLIAQAEDIKNFINSKNIGGIEELKLDVELGKPEMIIDVDRKKARRFNVSTSQIGSTLRTALFGQEVSTYKDGEDDYDIVVRLEDEYRYDADLLMDQRITFRDQTNGQIRQIPISSVAKASKSSTYSSVKRKDMKRLITITSNVLVDYNPNEVVAEIKSVMEDYDLPEENQVSFTGQQEEQAKEMSFLTTALLIAVFLIFLIIVSQFNSTGTPFIIVFSVVFSLTGVFLGLIFFRMDFIVIMTMIGIISLAGIVVNNAIVLVDYTNLLIARRMEELGLSFERGERLPYPELMECLAEGGKTRLRPVLLTAITTVGGLIPLATGLNINFISLLRDWDPQVFVGGDNVIFWGPMSWTIIFGLTFATFLTLVIVPVMVFLKIRLKRAFLA